MNLQLRQIVELIRKWFWLILLAALIGGGAGLAVNHFLPKRYQSSATVFVNSPNHIDYTSLLGAQQAAKAFASYPQAQPILKAALQEIGDKSLSETQLATMVLVQNDLDSQYVIIQVTDSDPVRAARLASMITMLSINQFQGTVVNGTSTKFLAKEIVSLQDQISSLEQELATLQSQPLSTNPTTQAAQTAQINQVLANLNAVRQQYSQDVTTYNDLTAIQITLLQDAQVPQKPIGLGSLLSALIGLLAGLIVIAGVIIFIEQTDDVLREPAKVEAASGLTTYITLKQLPKTARHLPWFKSYEPGKGVVITVKPLTALSQRAASLENDRELKDNTGQRLAVMMKQTASRTHMNGWGKGAGHFELPESFLALGVLLNSETRDTDHPDSLERYGRSLLITSPENGDGKTLIASQVALGLARIGAKVVLIDTNLRNPQIHKIFGVVNRIGLSTVLYTDKIKDVTGKLVDTLDGVLQPTPEPNLLILPSGPVVEAAPVLISSNRMADILERLSQDAFVVMDCPAVLTTSEAMILASKSDSILMVVNARRTTTATLNRSLGLLSHLHVPVRGVVLNQADKSSRA
jgi:protein-tyrosine kinase